MSMAQMEERKVASSASVAVLGSRKLALEKESLSELEEEGERESGVVGDNGLEGRGVSVWSETERERLRWLRGGLGKPKVASSERG